MPRYFFNIIVRGRRPILDPEGDELPGDKEARKHAEMVAQEMLERRIWYKRGLEPWVFVVTDESGRPVGVVPFKKIGANPKSDSYTLNRVAEVAGKIDARGSLPSRLYPKDAPKALRFF
jgi:hypothetical protein